MKENDKRPIFILLVYYSTVINFFYFHFAFFIFICYF